MFLEIRYPMYYLGGRDQRERDRWGGGYRGQNYVQPVLTNIIRSECRCSSIGYTCNAWGVRKEREGSELYRACSHLHHKDEYVNDLYLQVLLQKFIEWTQRCDFHDDH